MKVSVVVAAIDVKPVVVNLSKTPERTIGSQPGWDISNGNCGKSI